MKNMKKEMNTLIGKIENLHEFDSDNYIEIFQNLVLKTDGDLNSIFTCEDFESEDIPETFSEFIRQSAILVKYIDPDDFLEILKKSIIDKNIEANIFWRIFPGFLKRARKSLAETEALSQKGTEILLAGSKKILEQSIIIDGEIPIDDDLSNKELKILYMVVRWAINTVIKQRASNDSYINNAKINFSLSSEYFLKLRNILLEHSNELRYITIMEQLSEMEQKIDQINQKFNDKVESLD